MSTTKWMGLWAQDRQGYYAGQVIKKADIPTYTRVVLRYNKYYEKDGNKPRFVYRFADSGDYKDMCVQIEYEESLQKKVDELTNVLREAHNCPMTMLPSFTQSRADYLMEKAISIIEDITGEEWRFEYYTY